MADDSDATGAHAKAPSASESSHPTSGGSHSADPSGSVDRPSPRDAAPEPAPAPAASARPSMPRPPEPFVAMMTSRWGVWNARHAANRPGAGVALPCTLLAAALTWLVLALRQIPCRMTLTGAPNAYYRLCYSDIPVLYQARHLQEGTNPFGLEYPVGTGALVALARSLTQALGGAVGPNTPWPEALHSLHLFTAVTGVLLFVSYLALCVAHVRMQPTRPWDAMMIAAAPVVLATGLVNWDLACVALASIALWCWARRRPGWAGILLGLGAATKLYPALLLVPLFALCWRRGTMVARDSFVRTAIGFLLAWGIPNGLVAALWPHAWVHFWTFNRSRTADLGSLWYVAQLAGHPVPGMNVWITLLDVVGAAAVVALALRAPRRPRVGQLAYLMVAWFLVVNKVYSPQYVLWLLPLVVLARPRWRDYLIWTAAELLYFGAVWGHLAGTTVTPGTGQDRLYWMAVVIRVVAELWFASMVVFDMWNPDDDPVRADGGDDPLGGVLLDDDATLVSTPLNERGNALRASEASRGETLVSTSPNERSGASLNERSGEPRRGDAPPSAHPHHPEPILTIPI